MSANKPLGRKAYGSIPHLPASRLGPGDHHITQGQADICTKQCRPGDTIIVQEKLDGSCMAVARIDNEIVALNRAGYLASSSPREQHQLFAHWVSRNSNRFLDVLEDGEWLVGEWLAQAHGTRYALVGEPFVAFDIFVGGERALYSATFDRCVGLLDTARTWVSGESIGVEQAYRFVNMSPNDGFYGRKSAIEPVEGVVYRVEREGKVDVLAKWVKPDKIDGKYLPEVSGKPAVWNWRPE